MVGIDSLIVYFIVFAISVICYSLSRKKTFSKLTRVFLFLTSILIMVLFSGFRYYVGTDYGVYSGMQTSARWDTLSTFISSKDMELSYFFINYLGKLTNSLSLTLSLASLITMSFLIIGLKKFKIDGVLSYSIALLTFYPVSLNLVRQSLAMAVIFVALACLYNRQYIKFVLLVLFASTFHFTSILMLSLILFDVRIYDRGVTFKLKKYIVPMVLLLVSTYVVLNFEPIITLITKNLYFKKYSYLIISSRVGENRDIILNGILLLVIIIFGFNSYIKNDSQKTILFILMFSFILSFTGYHIPYAKRISMYTDLLFIVLVVKMIKSYKSSKLKYLFSFGFLTYGLIRFIGMYYYLGNAKLFPYVYKLFW